MVRMLRGKYLQNSAKLIRLGAKEPPGRPDGSS
jgi:hypothetical protein